MNPLRPIEPESAKSAEAALLEVLTTLLEAAVDQCAGANARVEMPEIRGLCDDAATLAMAAERIRSRMGD